MSAIDRWNTLVAFVNDHPSVGTPGVRDTDIPCELFEPGIPTVSGICETDGHYLCKDCEHRATCSGCGLRPVRCECEY